MAFTIDSGNLYIISAPSGTGKTTLVKTLVSSTAGLMVSISHTTRPKRPAETHGINYYFIDKAEFQKRVEQHEFLEHAAVFDHCYGTSRLWVEEKLAQGIDVILEIDWQGSQQIQTLFPDCVSIFILPPSLDALSKRLIQRNQDDSGVIAKRLADAQETITHIAEYDYMVLNDHFEAAVDDLKTILHGERLRQKRQVKKLSGLIAELTGKTKTGC